MKNIKNTIIAISLAINGLLVYHPINLGATYTEQRDVINRIGLFLSSHEDLKKYESEYFMLQTEFNNFFTEEPIQKAEIERLKAQLTNIK